MLNRSKHAAERLSSAQILDLWSIAHRSPRLARLFLALPSCAIAGFANSLVTSALWVRDGPVVRIETSITNFDPQVPPRFGCIPHMRCACACVRDDKYGIVVGMPYVHVRNLWCQGLVCIALQEKQALHAPAIIICALCDQLERLELGITGYACGHAE